MPKDRNQSNYKIFPMKLIEEENRNKYFDSHINEECTLDLTLRKKVVTCYLWSIALYGAETWTLRTADQKHLESFEMWCWGRMEKIGWTDHMRMNKYYLEPMSRGISYTK